MNAEAYVARWHADDGHHVVIVSREPKCLRVIIPGHPVVLRRMPLAEARYITALDYPLRRAARRLRVMARNNAAAPVRRFLDGLLK